MAHQETNPHGNEKKPVAFTAPLILGAVTVFIILLFVSLGDPCHGHNECACKENCSKECMEACEKGDHSMHPADMKHEEHHEGEGSATDAGSSKTEEHHEEGHH